MKLFNLFQILQSGEKCNIYDYDTKLLITNNVTISTLDKFLGDMSVMSIQKVTTNLFNVSIKRGISSFYLTFLHNIFSGVQVITIYKDGEIIESGMFETLINQNVIIKSALLFDYKLYCYI